MNDAFEAARGAFVEGLAHYEARRYDEAERAFRTSLEHLPGRASTLGNLGATLLKLGRPAEALPVLEQALAAEPGHLEAMAHRALALAELGQDAAALQAFDTLLQAEPANATAWLHRGLCLARLNRAADALASWDEALRLNDRLAEAHAHRGAMLKDLGRADEARAALQRALDLGAEPHANAYLLASLGGQPAPPAAPAGYVSQLFDGYAESFDHHLVDTLGYRVHEELPALAARHGGPFAAVLDLGCGTGLCGPALKRLTPHLCGIDLSPRMLERAQQRGVYDLLLQGEIGAYLEHTEDRFDLVLAADVFIYIGDLQAVFAGVKRVLRDGGLFAFSVELAPHGKSFELRASSRYAHSAGYLRALAAEHGFSEVEMQPGMLRLHEGRPLEGLLVVLRA